MKVLKSLFFTAVLLFQLNCTDADSNQSVNSAPTPQPANTEIVQATPAPAETPLPVFADADTAFAEGNKFFEANEIDKSIEVFRQAVKLNPDLAEAHFKLGICYAIREKETETVSEQPLEEPTPTPKNKKETPKLKDSEKAFESAVKTYKKFLAKNPKDDAAHFNLGRSYNKLNDDSEALKALRQAVKLKPDNSEYQIEMGEVLTKLAQYDEAVRVLKKVAAADETNLQVEEMLEKAQAGKRRVDFGKKTVTMENKPRPVEPSRPRATSRPQKAPAAVVPAVNPNP